MKAQKSVSSYYIIGYYTTNTKLERQVPPDQNFAQQRTFRQRGLSPGILHRQGVREVYASDKERQLEDALMLGDPITELTIALEVDYFQLNRAEYFVPIMVKIPGSELALARKGGAEHTLLDFIAR